MYRKTYSEPLEDLPAKVNDSGGVLIFYNCALVLDKKTNQDWLTELLTEV